MAPVIFIDCFSQACCGVAAGAVFANGHSRAGNAGDFAAERSQAIDRQIGDLIADHDDQQLHARIVSLFRKPSDADAVWAMYCPMAIDAVAAGEGALSTCTMRGACWM